MPQKMLLSEIRTLKTSNFDLRVTDKKNKLSQQIPNSTLMWNQTSLAIAYAFMYLTFFIQNSFDS